MLIVVRNSMLELELVHCFCKPVGNRRPGHLKESLYQRNKNRSECPMPFTQSTTCFWQTMDMISYKNDHFRKFRKKLYSNILQNNFFRPEISIPSSFALPVCLYGLIFSTKPSCLKSEPVFLNQKVTPAPAHCSRIFSTHS